MTINRYTGKTKDEAIAAAKAELGERIVIMNTKNRKPEGLLGIVKPSIWEVTVAIEDDIDGSVALLKREEKKPETNGFSAVADENIPIGFSDEEMAAYTPVPPMRAKMPAALSKVNEPVAKPATQNTAKPDMPAKNPQPANKAKSGFEDLELAKLDADVLKDTFRELDEVLSSSNIIKKEQIQMAPKNTEPNVSGNPGDANTKQEPNVSNKPANPTNTKSPANSGNAVKMENTLPLIKVITKNLIENEVDEKYINEIFDDIENVLYSSNSVDLLISNIYQKMVLKLGTPKPIELPDKGPLVVFFVGPTGVGKTTTIAKVASMFKIEHKKNVAFITADTYRIAATEQLNVYANILMAPISVIYGPEELNDAVEGFRDQDLILVDTVGFSHKNTEQKDATKALLSALDEKYKSENYLVLSVTTKYADLIEITDAYKEICDYKLIFTKLDETKAYGNILNIRMRQKASLSYITNGQNVPDDIEKLDSQFLVKAMLGGQ